jgi:Rrf2 family protein
MALHAVALLAQSEEGYASAYIAGSVNTHAVFLRRILKDLVAARIIIASEGRGGGYRLARQASSITLAEVYQAVELDGPLSPSPATPNPRCPIGAGMRLAFEEIAQDALHSMARSLSEQTVADLSKRALRLGERQ